MYISWRSPIRVPIFAGAKPYIFDSVSDESIAIAMFYSCTLVEAHLRILYPVPNKSTQDTVVPIHIPAR
jgi:hypothetical protein